MHIRHILFDLDGTLLPMNQDEFVTFYMPLLAKKYISEGISFDPKAFIASVWKGYGAMVNNDGSCTNREAFWQYMDELLPTEPGNCGDAAKQSVGQGCEKGKGKRNPHLPCNQSGISKGGNDEPDQMGGTGCRGF